MIPLGENTSGSDNQDTSRHQSDTRPVSQASSIASLDRHDNLNIKSEPLDFSSDHEISTMSKSQQEQELQQFYQAQAAAHQQREREHAVQNLFYNSFETKSESGSSDHMSRPQSPSSGGHYGSINDLLSHQMESQLSNMGPPKKFQLNKTFDKSYDSTPPLGSQHSPSATTTSSGKRANRTRFTDYQIKVLQEFFENNSYPKDSDLEYLSKLLLLSPRVIVVWFQVSIL